MSWLEDLQPWLMRLLLALVAVTVVAAALDRRWGWVAFVVGWFLALVALPAHGRRKAAQRADG